MKNALHDTYLVLSILLLAVLIGGLAFAFAQLVAIERNLSKTAAATTETVSLVNAALKGKHANGDDGYLVLTQRLLQNADGAANAIKQTAQDANRIGKVQEKKTAALVDASISTVNAGGAAVTKLSASLDSLNNAINNADGVISDARTNTLPRVNAGVDELAGLASDLRPTAKASTQLVQEAAIDVIAARHLLLDPNVPKKLESFALASAELVEIERHLNGTAADVQTGVHAMFNPRKTTFWAAVAMVGAKAVLGSAAGPLISHFWPVSIDIKNSKPVAVSVR
jgi:hypothetical protein